MSVLRTLPSGGVVFLRTRNGHPKIRGSLISYARDPWPDRGAGITKSEEASSRMPAALLLIMERASQNPRKPHLVCLRPFS